MPRRYFTYRKYPPCKCCADFCINDYLTCIICKKSYHRKCLKLSKRDFDNFQQGTCNYICDDKLNNCYKAVLPFNTADDIDFMDFLFGDGEYPCGKCKRECVSNIACIQCSVCDVWYHHVCTNLSDEEFISNYYFFCSRDCEVAIFPFYYCTTPSLVKLGILCNVQGKKSSKSKAKSKSKSTVLSIDSKERRALLSETVNYFTNRGSSMYVCLLDLTKAFDLVKHDILFTKLSKKVPPIF